MRQKLRSVITSRWFIGAACLLLGALIMLAIRLIAYSPEHVHYHANFAVYINGQREQFKDPTYYEEVATCTAETMTPAKRAHLHDNVNDTIHVHDHAVTWGQFFANLNWSFGAGFIQSRDGVMYKDDGTNKLHLILNGQDYTNIDISNYVIGDEDRLLISYGSPSKDDLNKQFESVPSTAHKYDISQDPASCSGAENPSLKDRFKHLLN